MVSCSGQCSLKWDQCIDVLKDEWPKKSRKVMTASDGLDTIESKVEFFDTSNTLSDNECSSI